MNKKNTGFVWMLQKHFGNACIFLGLALVLVLSLKAPMAQAATGINEQLNFQGRLLTSAGAVVPDGNYNMEFKIYCGGDGTPGLTSGDCTNGTTEHLLWTESRLNNSSQGVTLKNGYFSVNLGSVSSFGSSVDWNEDKLWISVNIGDTNGSCTPFSSCTPDGEMSPMKRLSASPYAFNALRLGGLTASSFGQLAANQTWTGTNTLQPTTDISGLIVKQTSVGSPTADILKVQTANGTNNIIQITGPAADEAAVNISSFGSTRDITLNTARYINLSGGNVGIGDSTPDALLHIASAGGLNSGIRLEATNASSYSTIDFYTPSGLTGQFVSSGASFTNGLIGGNQTVLANEHTDGALQLGALGTNGYVTLFSGGLSASNERLRVTSGGNIGIGTTAPGSNRLAVDNQATTDNILRLLDNGSAVFTVADGGAITATGTLQVGAITAPTSSNTINGLVINSGSLSAITGFTQSTGNFAFSGGGNFSVASAGLNVTTGGAVSGVTTLTVSDDLAVDTQDLFVDVSANKAGIGTAAPDSTLHVLKASAGTVTGTLPVVIESNSTSGIQALNPDDAYGAIYFGAPTSATAGRILYGGPSVVTANDRNALLFYTNNAEVMRIVSDGRTNIGGDTNPDALFTVGSTSQFQVSSSGVITAPTSSNTINGLIINSGALSGVTTLNASGALTAATSSNTINGLIINSGALSSITGYSQASGNFTIQGSGIAVFNEDGDAAADLRVESDTETNMFFVDSSANAIGIGISNPVARLDIGDSFTATSASTIALNVDTAIDDGGFAINGAVSLSPTIDGATVQQGVRIGPTFRPNGATGTFQGLNNPVTVGGSSANTITTLIGNNTTLNKGGSYTGVVTNGIIFRAAAPSSWAADQITNFTGVQVAATSQGNNLSSGTITLRGLQIQALSAAANGGTINAYGAEITVPSGNPAAGSNVSRGLYITGNGGASATKHALYSDSTAASYLAGSLGINTTGPDRKLDVLDASNPQIRLTHTDGSVYTDLQTDSSGYLNITNTGNRVTLGTSDTTATLLVLDTKTDAEGALTGTNGAMYYNSNSNKFRCYQNSAWTDCIGSGGSTTLQQAYTASAGASPSITLTNGFGGIVVRDGSPAVSGNLLAVQNNGGTATYLGVSATDFTIQNSSGSNSLVFNYSAKELKVYGAAASGYASITYNDGSSTAIFSASSGTTQIGSGTGDVNISLTGQNDEFVFDKAYTPAANYSNNGEFRVTRTLTATTFLADGNVLRVEDLSSGTNASSAPTVLYVNQNNTTFGGYLIRAQSGGSIDVFRVSTAGTVTVGGGIVAPSTTALDITANAASTWKTNGGAIIIQAGTTDTLTLNNGSTGDVRFFGSTYKITSAGVLTVASCNGCASTLQGAYNSGNSIETASNSVIITETSNAAHTLDLLQLTALPATGGSFAGDLLQLTMDAADANGFTGNGIKIVIDESQVSSAALPFVIADDVGAELFAINRLGFAKSIRGFVSYDGYLGQEFNDERAAITADATTYGDDGTWMADEQGTCSWTVPEASVGASTGVITASGGCWVFNGIAAGDIMQQTSVTNLPRVLVKLKPSLASSTKNTWAGLFIDNAAGNTEPGEGVYFTNAGGANWVGRVNPASGSNIDVSCGVAIDTSNYALIEIIIESSTVVRFKVDANVSDGINFTDCGTANPSGVTSNIGLGVLQGSSDTTSYTMAIDYARMWSDDPVITGEGKFAANSGLTPNNPEDLIASADLAEAYQVDDPNTFEVGELMSLQESGPIKARKSDRAYDRNMLGVYSYSPHTVMGQQSDKTIPIALSGRVPVKISTENGSIKKGDPITASSAEGVAMKSTRPGWIIGTALEDYDAESSGMILVFINRTWYVPLEGIESVSYGLDEVLVENGLSFMLKSGVKISLSDGNGKEVISFDNKGNADFAGIITADKIKANRIEGLELMVDKISSRSKVETNLNEQISELENASESDSIAPDMSALNMDKIEGLNIVALAGLESRGGLVVDGEARFNGKATFAAMAEFYSNALFKEGVTFDGHVRFNKDNGGKIIVRKDSKKVSVSFEKEYEVVPLITANFVTEDTKDAAGNVVDTAEAKLQRFLESGTGYVVGNITKKGFTLYLSKPASEDLNFNWLASAINNVKISETAPEDIIKPEGNNGEL